MTVFRLHRRSLRCARRSHPTHFRSFEQGEDISDGVVLDKLAAKLAVPTPTPDKASVERDHEGGVRRGVTGSPHFFTSDGPKFFRPSMDIHHRADKLDISFDMEGFAAFVNSAFA